MMFPAFEQWLNKTVCPIKERLILDTMHVVRGFGEMGLDGEFSLFWSGLDDDTSATGILDAVNPMLHAGLDKIIRLHGITLDTHRLDKKLHFAECLKQLNETVDHSSVMQILETDEPSNEMKMALLVEYIRGEHHLTWLPLIHTVRDDFIQRCIEVHSVVELVHNDTEFLKDHLRDYLASHPGRVLGDALRQGYAPGTPLDFLVNSFTKRLEVLAPNNPQDAAIELLGLALLSAKVKDDLVRNTLAKLEKMYIDLDFVTTVRGELTRMFAEMQIYG